LRACDLVEKSPAMWNEGYALLGYSQVVSPLLTTLAPDYSTKWGAELGAARVLMETPRPGESNLHYYLVTYWGRLDPSAFSLGATFRDLPVALAAPAARGASRVQFPLAPWLDTPVTGLFLLERRQPGVGEHGCDDEARRSGPQSVRGALPGAAPARHRRDERPAGRATGGVTGHQPPRREQAEASASARACHRRELARAL